jgi:hypothetical protein
MDLIDNRLLRDLVESDRYWAIPMSSSLFLPLRNRKQVKSFVHGLDTPVRTHEGPARGELITAHATCCTRLALAGLRSMLEICIGLQRRLVACKKPLVGLEDFGIPSDHQPVMANIMTAERDICLQDVSSRSSDRLNQEVGGQRLGRLGRSASYF